MLCNLGFADVWILQGAGDEKVFLHAFKQRCQDVHSQTILEDIGTMNKMDTFCRFKSTLSLEKYLSVIKDT